MSFPSAEGRGAAGLDGALHCLRCALYDEIKSACFVQRRRCHSPPRIADRQVRIPPKAVLPDVDLEIPKRGASPGPWVEGLALGSRLWLRADLVIRDPGMGIGIILRFLGCSFRPVE